MAHRPAGAGAGASFTSVLCRRGGCCRGPCSACPRVSPWRSAGGLCRGVRWLGLARTVPRPGASSHGHAAPAVLGPGVQEQGQGPAGSTWGWEGGAVQAVSWAQLTGHEHTVSRHFPSSYRGSRRVGLGPPWGPRFNLSTSVKTLSGTVASETQGGRTWAHEFWRSTAPLAVACAWGSGPGSRDAGPFAPRFQPLLPDTLFRTHSLCVLLAQTRAAPPGCSLGTSRVLGTGPSPAPVLLTVALRWALLSFPLHRQEK